MATLEGFATDPETGRIIEKGLINRTARKAIDLGGKVYNSVKNVFNSSGNKAINETTNSSNGGKQTNPEENFHDNPPSNSSTTSIDDTKENVNLT